MLRQNLSSLGVEAALTSFIPNLVVILLKQHLQVAAWLENLALIIVRLAHYYCAFEFNQCPLSLSFIADELLLEQDWTELALKCKVRKEW